MEFYQSVVAALVRLPPDAVRRFACACAARVAGVVEKVSAREAIVACKEVLAIAQGGMLSPGTANSHAARLETLADANIDDSLDVRYFGMQAIGLFVYAVRAAGGDVQAGPMAASLCIELAAGLCYRTEEKRLLWLVEKAEAADIERLASAGIVSSEFDLDLAEEYARCIDSELASASAPTG